jgi:hypothetical protein
VGESLLDHIRDNTIGLPWSSVILRSSIPEDLQGWVSRYSILVTQGLVLCTVDLLVSVSSDRKITYWKVEWGKLERVGREMREAERLTLASLISPLDFKVVAAVSYSGAKLSSALFTPLHVLHKLSSTHFLQCPHPS